MKRFLLSAFLLLAVTMIYAQTISVQGVLRDRKERALDDGFYQVIFKIYDAPTGGSALWTDTYSNLELRNGVFQVNLGENASIASLPFDKTYYVGVAVEGNGEMVPRLEMSTFPYALAINGNSNKFPSNGNVVIEEDSLKIYQGDIVLDQGALRLKGGDGRIVFNDGTSLNTAEFGGPAGSVNNPSGTTINADSDTTGTGSIHFQIAGQVKATVDSLGAFRVWDGTGTINYATGTGDLYVKDVLEVDGSIRTSTVSASSNVIGLAFIDAGNTSYYADPASTSNLNVLTTVTSSASTSMTAPRYNDTNSASYYLDPSSQSYFNGIWVDDQIYDTDNSTYRIKPSGTTVLSTLDVDLNLDVDSKIVVGPTNNTVGQVNIYAATSTTPALYLDNSSQDIAYPSDEHLQIGTGSGAGFSQKLVLTNNGDMGLGVSSPAARLHVGRGTLDLSSITSYMYSFATTGTAWTYSSSTWADVAGVFDDDVVIDGFIVMTGTSISSDERIKNIIGKSDASEDLQTLDKIEVTDYTMIDRVKNGDKKFKKVIAQQVKEVLPDAISMKSDVIPNIMAPANIQSEASIHTLTLNKPHELQSGDMIKLITEKEEISKLEVLDIIDENSFTVQLENTPEQIFVYGKWVDDFHVVDYDAISMLNVSATQELHKRIQALEAENAALKGEVSTLKAEVKEVSALAEKVAAIEKLLQVSTEAGSTVGQNK